MAIAAFASPPSTLGEKEDARGMFVETHKCSECHGVKAAGIEVGTTSEELKGPDLSGFRSDRGFVAIAAYVRKAGELDGKSHKKEFKGTDECLQTILDWLGSLEAQK